MFYQYILHACLPLWIRLSSWWSKVLGALSMRVFEWQTFTFVYLKIYLFFLHSWILLSWMRNSSLQMISRSTLETSLQRTQASLPPSVAFLKFLTSSVFSWLLSLDWSFPFCFNFFLSFKNRYFFLYLRTLNILILRSFFI